MLLFTSTLYSRTGNSLISFLCESLVFCEKISIWANRSKKLAIRSFLVSNLSDSPTLLIFGEQPKQFAHITHFWWATWAILVFLAKHFWANGSFAHLSWATWVNRSRLLICLERSEQIAYSLSAHLIWAKWANERMSNERMSEWANSQPCCTVWVEWYSTFCQFSKMGTTVRCWSDIYF